MNQQAPNPKTVKEYLSSFLNTLPPKIIGLIIIVALLLVSVILVIGVVKGQKVTIYPPKIEPPGQDKNSVSAPDLFPLSEKYFKSKSDKEEIIKAIIQLIDKAKELEYLEPNLYYKITIAQIMIQKLGGNTIDTSISDKDRIGAYKNIQASLKAIGFYEGEINGDQGPTNKSLKKFQDRYNKIVAQRDIIPPGEYGCFGYYTCFAIGKWSRTIGTDPRIIP